jgi:hypothetical protein
MATVNVKELTAVSVIPTYGTANNVIKSVDFNVVVYDDVVGNTANTSVSIPVQSILSADDLSANNYITANSTITQTEILNWAFTNVGGDDYLNSSGLLTWAEDNLTNSLYLSQGTSDYDFSSNPI